LFNNTLFPTEFPNDYTLVFNDSLGFGHSYDLMEFAVSQGENLQLTDNGKTNFKIFNMNTGEEISYIFYDENVISGTGRNGIIDPQDIIYFYEHDSLDSNIFSWTLTFSLRQSHSDSTVLDFGHIEKETPIVLKPMPQLSIPRIPRKRLQKKYVLYLILIFLHTRTRRILRLA